LAVSLITALTLSALAGGAAVVARKAQVREASAARDFPAEGQIIRVGDRRVHAVVQGPDNCGGPDLVLIHGASGNARDFTFGFAGRMATEFRVISFDRPGLGFTDRVHDAHDGAFAAGAESPAEQAGLLRQAAQALGADRPLVLGHSYGGAVALAWALDHPVAGIVTVGGVSMPWPDAALDRYYHINGSRLGGAIVPPLISAFATGAQVDAAMAAIFAPDPVPPGYRAHVGAELTIRRATLRANARQVRALYPHVVAMSARYPGLTVPVEMVHGVADAIVPLAIHSGPASGLIAGAVLTALPGVGHMPHHVAPVAVADAIRRVAVRAGLR